MLPYWHNNNSKEQKKIERSNIRYFGLICTAVGFLLLFITYATGGKLCICYGLVFLFAPLLAGMSIGLLIGILDFVISATKFFSMFVVLIYTGYELDDIKWVVKSLE